MSKCTVNKKSPYVDITFGDFKLTNKFAGFDLDNTLIKTKSGHKVPNNEYDWILLNDKIKSKLDELYKNNFCIVIFYNHTSPKTVDLLIKKIKLIGEILKLPFKFLASFDSDIYRKPVPTLFLNLTKNIKLDKQSFFCGDSAGRTRDDGDLDYKFAVNCELEFKTPEQLFLNQKVSLPPIKYGVDFSKTSGTNNIKFTPKNREIIIMVGMPGAGKSTFVKNHLLSNNYVCVQKDMLGTHFQCLVECEKAMGKGMRVAIDSTNPEIKTRGPYLNLAKRYGYSVRCIKMNCSVEMAFHNSYYRSFLSNGRRNHTSLNYYNKYKSWYDEPKKNEGISEIITIPFPIPNDRRYRYYYS